MSDTPMPSPATHDLRETDLSRYQRQIIFPPLGESGQRRLLDATVVIIGCGATGSALSNMR